MGDTALKTESSSQPPGDDSFSTSHSVPVGRTASDTATPRGKLPDRSKDNEMEPTVVGCYLSTTQDALIVVESCLLGLRNHCPRRPHDKERNSIIKSGSVFVYEDNASGIKRWTDGIIWSPSRIMGNFLIYRQLNQPFDAGEKKRTLKRRRTDIGTTDGIANLDLSPRLMHRGYNTMMSQMVTEEDRKFIGSLTDSYDFKKGGLVKKTTAVKYQNATHHVVNYYSLDDAKQPGRLLRPRQIDNLKEQVPRQDLFSSTNWRVHPGTEEDDDTYPQHPQYVMVQAYRPTSYEMVKMTTMPHYALPSFSTSMPQMGMQHPLMQHRYPTHPHYTQPLNLINPFSNSAVNSYGFRRARSAQFSVDPLSNVGDLDFYFDSIKAYTYSSIQYRETIGAHHLQNETRNHGSIGGVYHSQDEPQHHVRQDSSVVNNRPSLTNGIFAEQQPRPEDFTNLTDGTYGLLRHTSHMGGAEAVELCGSLVMWECVS
ncbi:Gluconate transport-inducing protein required for gluconate-H+ symport [Coniosporium tulheliwenetii]|uniref:Gluconate transport-inducing protein required for gluconate-H+ symport n=1 Tax=Coniosporium tulheliwenetii TaxID=3383036 RepID=A0ACC2YI92_9PEZI|nr:Gluconate transport-inducing protein required for gluconate-H+ symport [Cladosporium sp. JES 115]